MTSWLSVRNKFSKPLRKTRARSMPDASSASAKKKPAHIHHGRRWHWIHNRDLIVTQCVQFYQDLYRSRRLPMDTTEPQQSHRPVMDGTLPIILPTEVEASIKKLDHSMATGEDYITSSVLQNGG